MCFCRSSDPILLVLTCLAFLHPNTSKEACGGGTDFRGLSQGQAGALTRQENSELWHKEDWRGLATRHD